MADLAEDPLSPDWGQIDKGNPKAVSDALFTIWQLIHPQPIQLSQLSTDSQIIFNSQGNLIGDANFRYSAAGGVSLGPINATSVGQLRISSNDGNMRHIVIEVASNTANFQPRFDYLRARGLVTDAPKTIVQSGDLLGLIAFSGWDGSTYVPAAYLSVTVNGTPGSNDMPGALTFWTTPDGTGAPVERLRINNAGLLTALYDVSITGNLVVNGQGPHGIGGGTSNAAAVFFGSTFVSGAGAGNPSYGVIVNQNITGTVGGEIYGFYNISTLNESASGTHGLIAGMYLRAPIITAGGATVTNTASIYVNDAPTATVTGKNYALWIAAGDVRFGKFGAGTATFDASGNISSVSDERLKIPQAPFTPSLAEILAIRPIRYKWNKASGLDTENVYVGFSAQDVLPLIPEAVGKGPDGYYTFNDRPVLAAVVNAIQELEAEIQALRSALALPLLTHPPRRQTGEAGVILSRPLHR